MKNKIIYIIILIITLFISIFISKSYFENNYSKTNINTSTSIKKENVEIKEIKEEIKEDTFYIKLSFAGDTMIASYKDLTNYGNFNDYANKEDPSYFLSKVKQIFEEDDFTILNLENVLSDQNLSESVKSSDPAYWYKSGTKNIKILTSSSIEGVSVSNNHTSDYGSIGKQDTIDTIVNANMQYGDYNHIMYFEKNNFIIAVICKGLWSEYQSGEIINLIKEAESKSDYQIVFFHGGTERVHQPDEWKVRAARKLIDNGADLVIGSHPHVIQPREIYKDKEIVYSLGNFCYGGNKYPENRTIIYQMNLTININTKEVIDEESNIIPCYVFTGNQNNYQPAIITDEDIKNKVLKFMNWEVASPL